MDRRFAVFALFALLVGVAGPGAGCAKEKDSPRDAQWHYEMAGGYFESQDIQAAIRELKTAIEMNPKMAKAHFLLAFIYSGRKRYELAIKHYERAIELEPNYYMAKNNLGSVYLETNQWKEAAKLFRGLLEESMYATPELAHNNLGWALYNMGKYSKALHHFKRAVFLKPKMCLAYNNLGLTYEAKGQVRKAMQNYREAIERCSKYPEPHYNLGELLYKRRQSGARRHFQKCVELEPDTNLGRRCRQYLRR
ncbi:MAG: tetratricopeptide repeat protein [Bradymonadaceae bacterium]